MCRFASNTEILMPSSCVPEAGTAGYICMPLSNVKIDFGSLPNSFMHVLNFH